MNEVLCKVICHNLYVLIACIHEIGLDVPTLQLAERPSPDHHVAARPTAIPDTVSDRVPHIVGDYSRTHLDDFKIGWNKSSLVSFSEYGPSPNHMSAAIHDCRPSPRDKNPVASGASILNRIKNK